MKSKHLNGKAMKKSKDKTRLTMRWSREQKRPDRYTIAINTLRRNHTRDIPDRLLDAIVTIVGDAILTVGAVKGVARNEITVTLNYYHDEQ